MLIMDSAFAGVWGLTAAIVEPSIGVLTVSDPPLIRAGSSRQPAMMSSKFMVAFASYCSSEWFSVEDWTAAGYCRLASLSFETLTYNITRVRIAASANAGKA